MLKPVPAGLRLVNFEQTNIAPSGDDWLGLMAGGF
jgi:hypothetical protein